MANLYGSNYTKAFINVPSEKIEPGEFAGKMKVAYDEYDLDGLGVVLAANDIIYLMKIPAGARILEAIIDSPSLGTTGIVQLGTIADPDRYIASADAGGQAVRARMPEGADGAFEELSVETQLALKCTEISTEITGIVKVSVHYVMD